MSRREPAEGSQAAIRRTFAERGLRAKYSFGQCFLADTNIARRIALEATTPEGGSVLEIGAGTGALTIPLLERAARVVAIERDRDLVPLLREALGDAQEQGRLEVVEDDASTCPWIALLQNGPRPHVIAGNVPYQITGRLLERCIDVAEHVDRVVLMVQKEVADRVAAGPGSREYGALSVYVALRFRVVKRLAVPATCFRPQPKVSSSVIVLEPHQPVRPAMDAVLHTLIRTAFAKRRKTLRNAWRGVFELPMEQLEALAAQACIELDARAETLSADAYVRLAGAVRASLTDE